MYVYNTPVVNTKEIFQLRKQMNQTTTN